MRNAKANGVIDGAARARRAASRRAALALRASLLLAFILWLASAPAEAQTCVANPGKDGPGGTLAGVVNTYYPGASTANSGAVSITLGAANTDGALTPIAVGDLLLVIQMQDAAINSTNTSAYGANNGTGTGSTGLNNSGRYEYVVALSALGTGGGTVSIRGTGTGNGLVNTYTNAAASGTQGQRRFQVVRVPQYSSATLGSTLTAASWDGGSGGILVFDVAGALSLGSASVSVNGLGFRGGGGRALAGGGSGSNTDYRNLASRNFHGMKGEGIAGTPRYVYDATTNTVLDTGVDGYPNGSSARGAPGNAGGGGTDGNTSANDQNSGGGGGGNGGDGGVGGNTWSSNLAVGGIGGDTVTGAANLVVMGGGGGAGSRNNSATVASSGGAGGGIVMIRAGSTSGTGTISANGADAYNPTDNDGAGGGGAGGSVVVTVSSGSLAGLAINARGGRGGNAWSGQAAGTPYPGNRHGPGGGGGGGFVVTTGGATLDVSGGSPGTTTTSVDTYGATGGGAGQSLTITPTQVPGVSSGGQCVPALTVTKTTSTPTVNNTGTGTTASYSIVVSNAANRNAATSLSVSDTLPTNFTYASTGTVTLGGGATRPSTTNPTAGATVPNWGTFTIPGGGSVTIPFTVNIAAGVSGTQQNPATATYFDPGRTTANGTTTASYNPASSTGEDVNVLSPPDMTISKSHSGNFTQGQSGTYTLTATNSGQQTTSGQVTVTDTLPAGLTPGTATGTGWTCNTSGQTVTCNRSDALSAGSSYPAISLPVTVAPNSALSVTNTASVSGGGQTNTGNDSASDPTTINGVPDVTIAKSHSGNFTQGQSGSYTLTVSNAGGAATSGTVTVTDTLPAGLNSPTGSGTGWSCSTSGQTLTCTRSDALAAGANYPAITVSVSVASNSALSVTNSASVSGGGQTNTSNDSANDPTTINGVPDLAVAKSHSGNFTQGGSGSYTVTVSNAGGAATSGTVTVTDAVPSGLTSPTGSGTGWSCSTSGLTVTCTRSDALAAGASYPAITVGVSVASNSPLSVTNTASVSGGGQTNTGNDTANDPTTVSGVPDVTITKTHSGNFSQGQTGATYTLTVTNAGGAATSGTVTVTDTLPAGLTSPAGSGTGWTCSTSSQTVTCTRSSALAAGASYPAITVTVDVATNAASSVTNSASVSGGGQTNTGNDSASDPTTVNSVPNLTIAKSHAGNFTRGQSGSYTLTVTNSGGAATSGQVTVTDNVPAGLTSPAGSGTGWTCGTSGQVITCTRSNALAAGASYPAINVTAGVAQSAASSVTNTASVSGGGQTFTGDDTASDPTTVVSSADLSLTKTVNNASPIQGQNVTFTVTLANAGPSDATGVAVTDALPAGLTFVSATPSAGSYNSGTGVWSVASLASGASATLQIVAHVDNAGSITNTAEVTASNQPDPDSTPNNHNAAEDDQASASIGAASPPDVSLVKSVSPGGTQLPGTDLTYTVVFTNSGGAPATNFVLTDPDPATTLRLNDNTDFKVGSVVNNLGTTGLGVTVAYSNDGGATWTYTPVSGAGGAPTGYDRNVTHIRWTFTGNLSQTAPNNTGSVSFTTRIR